MNGFEKVLGRKWHCEDCKYCIKTIDREGKQFNVCYKFHFWFREDPTYNRCMDDCFVVSDKIKAGIKLKDKQIENTKIDTHPRYWLSTTTIHENGFNVDTSWKYYDWELIL